jgi:TPR repeat protein
MPICNGLFAGHVSALFNLAVCYMDGDGVPANAAKAVRFLLKAAEAGHKQSQYQVLISRTELQFLFQDCRHTHTTPHAQLALCYKQGKGVGSDKREAVYWFRKAAVQGHTVAQAFLQGSFPSSTDISELLPLM